MVNNLSTSVKNGQSAAKFLKNKIFYEKGSTTIPLWKQVLSKTEMVNP